MEPDEQEPRFELPERLEDAPTLTVYDSMQPDLVLYGPSGGVLRYVPRVGFRRGA